MAVLFWLSSDLREERVTPGWTEAFLLILSAGKVRMEERSRRGSASTLSLAGLEATVQCSPRDSNTSMKIGFWNGQFVL